MTWHHSQDCVRSWSVGITYQSTRLHHILQCPLLSIPIGSRGGPASPHSSVPQGRDSDRKVMKSPSFTWDLIIYAYYIIRVPKRKLTPSPDRNFAFNMSSNNMSRQQRYFKQIGLKRAFCTIPYLHTYLSLHLHSPCPDILISPAHITR